MITIKDFQSFVETTSWQDMEKAMEIVLDCLSTNAQRTTEYIMLSSQLREKNHFSRAGLIPAKELELDRNKIKYDFYSALRELALDDLDLKKVEYYLSQNQNKQQSTGVDFAKISEQGIKELLNKYKQFMRDNPDDTDTLSQIGVCYLELGLFDIAKSTFKKCIDQEPDHHLNYYYHVLSLIRARRLKVLTPSEVREIESYLKTAIAIKDEAHFHSLMANLKDDYYQYNGLGVPSPGISHHLELAHSLPPDSMETQRLKKFIPYWKPGFLND